MSDKAHGAGNEALPRLLAMSRQSATWSMRLQAVQALGKLGGPEACAALIDALANDTYAYVREQAAHWVGAACPLEAPAALTIAKQRDPEPRVRDAATSSLSAP
jgi:HEAT repeat protein